MFGLGTQELLIILVLVMILFGAGKLPLVGGALGSGIRNFRKAVEGKDDSESRKASIERSPPNLD